MRLGAVDKLTAVNSVAKCFRFKSKYVACLFLISVLENEFPHSHDYGICYHVIILYGRNRVMV